MYLYACVACIEPAFHGIFSKGIWVSYSAIPQSDCQICQWLSEKPSWQHKWVPRAVPNQWTGLLDWTIVMDY